MGVVFKARQRVPERVVALKLLLPAQLANEEARRRFRVEAEAAARLEHPNIVPIYEVGEAEDVPYFSMRLVEGESLRRWNANQAARGGERMRRAAGLMVKLALAVHYAHERGVLHRDIKPSNVLLDAQGEPYLTDFGLAKLVAQTSDLTVSGAVVGTPDYMSPEQARGGTKDVTTATDVFSLGAVLYELLTGQAPFHGETDLETRRRVVEEEAARPSAINRAVDRDLQTICLKCLEKDPRRRYDSAAALAEDLERWLRHEPIHARPAGAATRAFKWTRRHIAATALAAVAVVGLAGYAVKTTMDERRLRVVLAESLLHEGKALAATREPSGAKDRLERSRSLSLQTGRTTLPADLALADLHRFSPPPVATWRGHAGPARCVAVSSSRRTIISGGDDGTIRLWALPSGRVRTLLDAHPGGVTCLAVSLDGRLCVSGGADKRIQLWDLDKPALIESLESHRDRISGVCFAPGGGTFASASWDGTIRIWPASGHKEKQVIQTELEQITSVVFLPDGARVAAGNEGGGFGVWRLDAPDAPALFLPFKRGVRLGSPPSSGSDSLLLGGAEGELVISPLAGSNRHNTWRALSAVTGVAFLPPGKRVVAGCADGRIAVVNATFEEADPQLLFTEHTKPITGIAPFAEGNFVASSSEDGTVRIWDTRTEEPEREPIHSVCRLTFSPDGLVFLSAGHGGQLKLWDATTGELLLNYPGHEGVILDGRFSPDGSRIISCGQDGTARIWSTADGNELRRLNVETGAVSQASFSRDGKLLLTGEGPEDFPATPVDPKRLFSLRVWDASSGRPLRSLPAHRGGILALAVSSRGVVTGGADGKMKLWDPNSWREILSFDADPDSVRGITILPDGCRCISIGSQRALRIWDLLTGKEVHSLQLGDSPLSVSAGSSQHGSRQEHGLLLLCGMGNGTMRLRDGAAGGEMHLFEITREGGISATALSPDGRLAVSATTQSLLHRWSLNRIADFQRLAPGAQKAHTALQQNPRDPAALKTLAEWFEFRGFYDWAGELYREAREAGAEVPSLPVARCLWQVHHLEEARAEFARASDRHEVSPYYLTLCLRAIDQKLELERQRDAAQARAPMTPAGAVVRQPGPGTGCDIWTTSHLSYAPGGDGPGGGWANDDLRVGGWGDWYYSLLRFDLAGMPPRARSAVLHLYCKGVRSGGTPMWLDRIAASWDWRTSGTGRDRERLWWQDRPAATLWRKEALPRPDPGRWYAVEITDLYNSWQNGEYPNHGVQLRPTMNSNEYFNEFYSSRYESKPELRPKLVVVP
jgi:WD40 repeat protein